uniref:Pectate lyase C n=1 Tax=Moniliophthora roreri TaxID=221103 RepID=A0A0W0FLB5_MONRR
MKLLPSLVIPLTVAIVCSALPAFPGAEGFGAEAIGAREGGEVYIVTDLNDSGEGSFRDAVSQSNRIVVFAVGGVINIDSRIVIKDHVYIAGQTAPGQGITVYGNGVSSLLVTFVIAWARVATLANGENMMFDHVSVSWGRVETFSINGDVSNITISDSMIAQGLDTHSCGGLMQSTGGVSIFRSLYIDNKTRNPKVSAVSDFIGIHVYNWGSGGGYIAGDSDGPSSANIMNNIFIRYTNLWLVTLSLTFEPSGPDTSAHPFTRGNENFEAYVKDSYYDSDQDGTLNGNILGESETNYSPIKFRAERFDYPAVANLLSPTDALEYVMANAGASLPRDHVDDYLINTELASLGKTGNISDPEADPIGGPGPLEGGEAPTDTDQDGIPDEYETAAGTDPNKADSMEIADNGYTHLENYVNSLVS